MSVPPSPSTFCAARPRESSLARHLSGGFDPFVDQLLVILGPHLGQPFGVEPRAVDALSAEVMPGLEPRRIVEAGDGQVHAVAALLEDEAERSAAIPAIGPP